MNTNVRIQLSVMMFLQFFIWGAWYVTGPNYLSTIGFGASDFGWMYSVGPIAGMISPFFVGMIADRFFAEVEALIQNIEISPERFHPAQRGMRRANLENFPYHFLYRTHAAGTRILVLRHHRRHPFHGIRRK